MDGGPHHPVITLTTDFGDRDYYVAAMKAVLLRHRPGAQLIDVTHQIPRHDVVRGSIVLERAIAGFFPGTVHLVVVDPGVGTDRRILVAEVNGQCVVCPDNGLITWAWRRLGSVRAHRLIWRPTQAGNTFDGRDIMAPAVGMLAAGTEASRIATPIDDPVLLDLALAPRGGNVASVIHIDVFGNVTTNMEEMDLRQRQNLCFVVAGKNLGGLRRTYQDVPPGQPLALIGSSGLLEIAVRDGSAAEILNLRVGDNVTLP